MSFEEIRGLKSGVGRRGNAREGAAVLMNERLWMCVREIRRINSRIMYVSICMRREFSTIIVVYAPGRERPEEERGGFWEELKSVQKYVKIEGK